MDVLIRNQAFNKVRYSDDYGVIDPISYDVNIGLYGASANDFQLVLPLTKDIIPDGYFVSLGNTEYGGKIKGRLINYDRHTITYKGRTLRGQMEHVFCNTRATSDSFGTAASTCGEVVQEMIDATTLHGIYSVKQSPTTTLGDVVIIPAHCDLLKAFDLVLSAFGCSSVLKFDDNGVGIYIEPKKTKILQAVTLGLEVNDDRLLPTGLLGYHTEGNATENVNVYLQADGSIGTTRYYSGMDAYHVSVDIGKTANAAEALAVAKDRLRAMRNAEYLGSLESDKLDADVGDTVIVNATEYGISVTQTVSEKVLSVAGTRQKLIARTGGNNNG